MAGAASAPLDTAVRNQIARLVAEVAAADCAARAAFAALGQAGDGVPAYMARLTTNCAAAVAIAVGHQVHGAIGFTLEYPLHPYTRCLVAWRSEFGSDAAWAVELGAEALAQGKGLWVWMADGE